MDRKTAALAWPFSYLPSASLAHNHLQETRDKSLEADYALSFSPSHMAADRSGSFLAPCYWPPHYSAPFSVSQHTASNQPGKRTQLNPCECTTCVTSPSLAYKPFFVTPQDGMRSENLSTQMYTGRDGRQTIRAATNDPQAYKPTSNALKNTPCISPPLCVTDKEAVDSISAGPRRGRTVFTAQQLQVLERVFSNTQYIVGSQRKFLANQLRLSETQVRVWFQNRRIKWRKQMLTHAI